MATQGSKKAASGERYSRLRAHYDLLSSRLEAGTSLLPDMAYADFLKGHDHHLSLPNVVPDHTEAKSGRDLAAVKPRPLSANTIRQRAQKSIDESSKRLKTIEDLMWQHRQEERNLRRAEMDVVKQKKHVQRTIKDYGSTPPTCPTPSPSQSQEVDIYDLIARLKEHVQCNRIRVSEHFQDFDPLRSGSISNTRFRQYLLWGSNGAEQPYMYLTEPQFESLCQHYRDPKQRSGVCWKRFLSDIDQHTGTGTTLPEAPPTTTLLRPGAVDFTGPCVVSDDKEVLETVMFRLREKVKQRRVLAKPCFQDFDRFVSQKDPTYVDYMRFSDEIESIFTTKHLEKTPTAVVSQFVPPVEVDCNSLSPEEEQILLKTLHRLAERVRVRRIQIFPLFEDYDRVHIGSVTRSQFHRVLSELEMGGLVNALEFGILYRKFDVKVGGRSDVNYIAFCEMIDDYAQTKWTDPTLK